MIEHDEKAASEASTSRPSPGAQDELGEVSEGFFVRRRSLLWLPALAASALLFGRRAPLRAREYAGQDRDAKPAAGGADRAAAVETDWDTFIKEGGPEVRRLYQDPSPRGQDAYLYALAQWAARLRLDTLPRAERLGPFGSFKPAVNFGVSYRGAPFFVVEWWLEPGATLPPHNHPNASVCTLGFEGEARMRNFEVVGSAPEYSSKEVFRVRETHSQVMAPGRINCLSSTRDNIHTFRAGKSGARGIDITTVYGSNDFSFLDIEAKPRDADGMIFGATWRKI